MKVKCIKYIYLNNFYGVNLWSVKGTGILGKIFLFVFNFFSEYARVTY